jgi:hypothetical protein
LEINPRAAAITELVLWIGYLQWHFRTRGQTMPAEPVLKKFKNIECRDAVLAYDGEPEPARDEAGNVTTVWDRKSMKKDPVTGRDVPDETKRVALLTYKNPRPAEWPVADFIVGNPPFVGNKYMRDDLGDGYTETLRTVYPKVEESADFVMYWWHKAAYLVRTGQARQFGLITTNSISQTFNRRVVEQHFLARPPLSLIFAIADHPWVDTADGAAVRIAMTVGRVGEHSGELLETTEEQMQGDGWAKVTLASKRGRINSNLTLGADVSGTRPLQANEGLSSPGVKLHGAGFILPPDEANSLGLGTLPGLEKHVRPYRNGKDITDESRGVMVIDLFGLQADDVRHRFPAIYQRVLTTVRPEREHNNRASYRDNWWVFGEPRREIRPALLGLARFIVTPVTSKHRFFCFLDSSILPDDALIAVAVADALFLGILSSRIHVVYALASGGTLEDRPRYNKSRCFDPFPFPACDAAAQERIRKLAEELDAHRKRVQSQTPGLTLTGMYNVLEKLRANESLSAKEKQIHDAGLVSVLRQLHDELDTGVFAAYGWPPTLTDAEILERLVALNAERAKEEASGLVRWLRPDYQNPGGAQAQQTALAVEIEPGWKPGKRRSGKLAWPKTLSERVKAVSTALAAVKEPVTAPELAKRFARARAAEVGEILETLCAVGKARRGHGQGTFLP